RKYIHLYPSGICPCRPNAGCPMYRSFRNLQKKFTGFELFTKMDVYRIQVCSGSVHRFSLIAGLRSKCLSTNFRSSENGSRCHHTAKCASTNETLTVSLWETITSVQI